MEMPDHGPVLPAVPEKPTKASVARKWFWRLFRLFLLIVVLGATGSISYHWISNPPVAQRRPPKPESVKVEVFPVAFGTQQVIVGAMGTVVPAREIQIAARVGGQIVAVHPDFQPGGQFRAGEALVCIDPKDYELAVQQQAGNLTKVESDVKLEMGQQAVARREYEILGETAGEEDEELVLRQPQLAAKEAAVSVARAALDKARLDLERTEVLAPFNALLQARLVDLGSYVSPGAPLASLVGTDEFWVEVSVPVDELDWIDIPEDGQEGSKVLVYNTAVEKTGEGREGTVKRLLADLEPQGRMARLLVSVQDPMVLEPDAVPCQPLLLGSFVRVEIGGKDLLNVASVPRTALRDGSRVWVMSGESALDIRDVEVVWSGAERVYVSHGLAAGDMVVVSDLPAPVQGMALRTGDEAGPGMPVRPGPAEKTERPA